LPSQEFWADIWVTIKNRINRDAKSGILQGENHSDNYVSKSYKKYKNNYMNRFTDRTGKKGSKLKAYTGQSIKSNKTDKVNMILTGQLFNRLTKSASGAYSVTMDYGKENEMKIEGNEERGRDVRNYNDKNMNELTRKLDSFYQKKFNKGIKNIIINIGKYNGN
jgi:hypothetical protein